MMEMSKQIYLKSHRKKQGKVEQEKQCKDKLLEETDELIILQKILIIKQLRRVIEMYQISSDFKQRIRNELFKLEIVPKLIQIKIICNNLFHNLSCQLREGRHQGRFQIDLFKQNN